VQIQEAVSSDRPAIAELLRERWGSTTIISLGREHDAATLPALVATEEGSIVGLATVDLSGPDCELVSLDALSPSRGIGSALLGRVAQLARDNGCARVWLITTNDNLDALRFYQRRGMRLVTVHRGGADAARRMKPSIPVVGNHGIPIHDELELELRVD
jgi:N-acetylglutamate synthase-like GNAT family acetyltransferase